MSNDTRPIDSPTAASVNARLKRAAEAYEKVKKATLDEHSARIKRFDDETERLDRINTSGMCASEPARFCPGDTPKRDLVLYAIFVCAIGLVAVLAPSVWRHFWG